MPSEHYSSIAKALLAFALDTSAAAEELMAIGPTGGTLSDKAQRVLAVWRGLDATTTRYAHPTAAAIAEDEETADFALVSAVRALKDALDSTQLPADLRLCAAALLLHGQGGQEEVDHALAEVRLLDQANVPFDKAMRTLSKALHMAAHYGREGRTLPPEMVDFVGRAAAMIEQDRILLDRISVTGHENTAAPARAIVIEEPVRLKWTKSAMDAAHGALA